MKLAIMQPYLFPYIGYYQLIKSADKFVVYDDVAFIKQGWINRNNILVNKQKHLFFVPVKAISSFKKISETEVDYKFNWAKKMVTTIEQAYKKAPHFGTVFPMIEHVLCSEKKAISELAFESLKSVSEYLSLKTIFEQSSAIYNNEQLKGKERVLDICLREKASHYINPIGGMELYSEADFANNNLLLSFIKTRPLTYNQFNNEHVPWLSIIDVLMFNSKEEVNVLLDQYDLI